MRTHVLLLLVALGPAARAQLDTTTITLDVLHAPVSPASVLLGMAESEIQRPTGLTDFMVSVQQGTNDFSRLPGNFAVDLAPAWLLGKHVSASDMLGMDASGQVKPEHLPTTIWQSLVISTAVKDPEGTDGMVTNPSAGFGFKFSLCRGNATEASRNSMLGVRSALHDYNLASHVHLQTLIADDREMQRLDSMLKDAVLHVRAIQDTLAKALPAAERAQWESALATWTDLKRSLAGRNSDRAAMISAETKSHTTDAAVRLTAMKAAAENFKVAREGFFWDVAGGLVLDFLDRRLDNSLVSSAGFWTTLSWDTSGNFPFQLMGRYLYNPDHVFIGAADSLKMQDIHNLDAGARLSFAPPQGRFSFSAEALFRTVLNADAIDPTWRLVANAQYAVSTNNLLSFSFGKHFDGTTTKDGNLVAALNFLVGLGGKRKVD